MSPQLDRRPRALPRRGHTRPGRLCDQAGPGGRDAHPGAGCRGGAGWVTGDEVNGANPTLRAELEARQVGYVLAVAYNHRLLAGGRSARADELGARVPARAWQTISAECGAKGHRLYD
jgi:hypothetical protein